MSTRTRAEYGGFLPLELNEGQEYFKDYSGCLRRYNSVKAALYYLIDSVPIKHIYIPYYYCPTTTQAIKNTGIDVSFYHITQDLLPEELPDEADSAVLLVNYFGVRSEKINSLASCFSSPAPERRRPSPTNRLCSRSSWANSATTRRRG